MWPDAVRTTAKDSPTKCITVILAELCESRLIAKICEGIGNGLTLRRHHQFSDRAGLDGVNTFSKLPIPSVGRPQTECVTIRIHLTDYFFETIVGAVRDVDAIEELGVPMFARAVTPRDPTRWTLIVSRCRSPWGVNACCPVTWSWATPLAWWSSPLANFATPSRPPRRRQRMKW